MVLGLGLREFSAAEPKRLAGGVGVSDQRDKLNLESLPQPRCGF
jgi:hypothetical protein